MPCRRVQENAFSKKNNRNPFKNTGVCVYLLVKLQICWVQLYHKMIFSRGFGHIFSAIVPTFFGNYLLSNHLFMAAWRSLKETYSVRDFEVKRVFFKNQFHEKLIHIHLSWTYPKLMFLHLQFWTKYFQQSKEITSSLARLKKFNKSFCLLLWLLLSKFYFWKGYCTFGCTQIWDFSIFSNSLRS